MPAALKSAGGGMRLSLLFDDPAAKAAVTAAENDAIERMSRLTPRERQVLLMITDGLLNKQTAHELGVSARTVENHRLRLMEKTGVKTMAQLVRLSLLAG
jgi:FixJ family two-component response regulator